MALERFEAGGRDAVAQLFEGRNSRVHDYLCKVSGRCTSNAEGQCIAASDKHCKSSLVCFFRGRCSAREGDCIAADNAGCAAATDCKERGLCVADQDRCVASEASCRASQGCHNEGRCSLQQGRCIPATESDCRASKVCKENGHCTAPPAGLVPEEGLVPKEPACTIRLVGGYPFPVGLAEQFRFLVLLAGRDDQVAFEAVTFGLSSGVSDYREAVCLGASRSSNAAVRHLLAGAANHLDPYTRRACSGH